MLLRFCCLLSTFSADRKGVAALEYALMAALIAVVILTAVTAIGTNATSMFNTIASNV